MSAACTSSFVALVAEASRLAAEAETGEVDHDAITSLTEDILAAIAELTPEQAQHLHGIVGDPEHQGMLGSSMSIFLLSFA